MMDRAAFDAQIAEISNRYKKLCSKGQRKDQTNGNIAQECSPTREANNQLFKTPAKHNKKQYNQQFVSFSKTQHKLTNQNNLTSQNKLYDKSIKDQDSIRDTRINQRLCFTSREQTFNSTALSSKLEEKQKILAQRMKENQRLLAKSKQLRESQSRNTSNIKNNRNFYNDQQTKILGYNLNQNIANTDKSNLKLSVLRSKETTPLTERTINQKKYTPVNKTKQDLEKYYSNIKNQVIRKIDTTIKEQEFRKKNTHKENGQFSDKILPMPVTDKMSLQATVDSSKKPGDLKLTSVFENTAKIQERIRAILSFH